MSELTPNRGGAPVGYVSELGPVEARAVRCLRQWNDGPEAQADMCQELAQTLGFQRGEQAASSFASLCDLCARHGRRPLMRHSVSCKCVGADESCFANFIGYACEGAREDAFLMAATLVRPDMATVLVGLAEEFGLSLKQMALRNGALRPTHGTVRGAEHRVH
jgi:hypothetical protein